MKILFVAPYTPSNIRIRPYHFIKGLSKKGHSITFVGLQDAYSDKETIKELRKYCDSVEIFKISKINAYFNCSIGLFGKMPLQSAFCFSRKMKNRIKQITLNPKFDLIHMEHIRAGYLLPNKRTTPAIYDSVDCITSLYQMFKKEQSTYVRKLIAFIESKKLEKAEPKVLSKYDRIIVSTFRDKNSLESLSRKADCVIPEIIPIVNGVDCEYFKAQKMPYEPYSIVFTGKMGYYANELAAIHFACEIFPLIKSKMPNAKLYIVGADPSKRVRQLNGNNDIIVTGWVSDIRKYLNMAHVVVCPVRVAAGIQNKLLEALSMAKAVVTYPEVALPLKPNNNKIYLVAKSPDKFAENILKIMNNEFLRIELEKNARAFIQNFYTWDENVKKLEEVYLKTVDTFNCNGAKKTTS